MNRTSFFICDLFPCEPRLSERSATGPGVLPGHPAGGIHREEHGDIGDLLRVADAVETVTARPLCPRRNHSRCSVTPDRGPAESVAEPRRVENSCRSDRQVARLAAAPWFVPSIRLARGTGDLRVAATGTWVFETSVAAHTTHSLSSDDRQDELRSLPAIEHLVHPPDGLL